MLPENMQEESTQENREQNTTGTEKEKKREFGLPAGVVQHFETKGIAREELAQMSIDDVLAQAGPLDGKALNKAVQTVLKTTRDIEQLKARLELVSKRPAEAGESLLEGIVNSVLHVHGHTLYTREQGSLLNFAYLLATEAAHANVKYVGRTVLAHLPVEAAELNSAILEKMDNFFPDTDNLGPGQEDKMEYHIALFGGTRKSKERLREYISVRAEAIAILARKSTCPLSVWKQVLGIYKKADREALPEEKVRALGLAVLKTLKSDGALVDACSQYVQSMRMSMHDFGYGQFFLAALQPLPPTEKIAHVIEKLVIYALTENRGTVQSLGNMGISKLPRDRILSILEKVRAENINIVSSTPVLKQIVRAFKQSPEDLQVLEKYIAGILATRRHTGLRDVLKHVRASIHPEGEKKPHRGPGLAGVAETETETGEKPAENAQEKKKEKEKEKAEIGAEE